MNSKLTLARTTIGDLLLENRISQASTDEDLSGVTLSIPDYQRPYTWGTKHAIQLLDDIIEAQQANNEVYRVGTLILHHNGSRFDIVDGQQRVITFALMLELLSKNSSSSISFLDQPLPSYPVYAHNIRNNHDAMMKRLGVFSEGDKNSLSGYIVKCCEFIVFITDGLAESFLLFDSQNARGKQLYPHDLLKAYHLREMTDLDEDETEAIVQTWEDMDQVRLARLFGEYLYRIKRWHAGNYAYKLSENNISIFKGITSNNSYPYAQLCKGAYAHAEAINQSSVPFVLGLRKTRPFQLNSPIVAGKPFFDYAKCYFDMLQDIQENDRYAGVYVRGNEVINMLDEPENKNGTGNRIARMLFDSALLMYVDRFYPEKPSAEDKASLDQAIELIFVWAYSLRAQYQRLGWDSAQNYILKTKCRPNAINIYKAILQADFPYDLFTVLQAKLRPLQRGEVKHGSSAGIAGGDGNEKSRSYLDHLGENWISEE